MSVVPPKQVDLKGIPALFSEFETGYKRSFLQYLYPENDLAVYHTAEYMGMSNLFGKECHEVRCTYYEIEYPDAVVEFTLFITENEKDYTTIAWHQRYPDGNSEYVKANDMDKRFIIPGEKEEINGSVIQTDPAAFRIKSGDKDYLCLRMLKYDQYGLIESYVDFGGSVRLNRYYTASVVEGSGKIEINNKPYYALYDEIPSELIYAVWVK